MTIDLTQVNNKLSDQTRGFINKFLFLFREFNV